MAEHAEFPNSLVQHFAITATYSPFVLSPSTPLILSPSKDERLVERLTTSGNVTVIATQCTYAPRARRSKMGRSRVAVCSISSGTTRTLPTTDMKFVSASHRGTTWMCR